MFPLCIKDPVPHTFHSHVIKTKVEGKKCVGYSCKISERKSINKIKHNCEWYWTLKITWNHTYSVHRLTHNFWKWSQVFKYETDLYVLKVDGWPEDTAWFPFFCIFVTVYFRPLSIWCLKKTFWLISKLWDWKKCFLTINDRHLFHIFRCKQH